MTPNPPTTSYDSLLISIIDYVHDTDITFPTEAIQSAQLSLLDALGCASESVATSADCRALIGPYITGTSVPNGFKLPGTGFVLDPVKGAFDLGVLIRYLDHNDGFTGLEWGHPSGRGEGDIDTLGAICAVADCLSRGASFASAPSSSSIDTTANTRPTIHTILCCLIRAYEIQGRLQLGTALNRRGLDHVFFTQIAACAVVSGPALLNLNREQALAALSFCVLDNAPLRAYRQRPNTIPRKGWAAASAVSRAVQLALIARARGQVGATTVLSAERWGFEETVLKEPREGESKAGVIKRLELGGPQSTLDSYVVRNVFYKLMPCEGHSLTAVEACVQIRQRMGEMGIPWQAENVARVNIRTHAGAVSVISKPAEVVLQNFADRDHCLEYMCAVALLKGAPPESADYADESMWVVCSEPVDELRRRMVVIEDEQFSRDYHDPAIRSLASGVSLELSDGTLVGEVVIEHPLGSRKHGRTVEAVWDKIRRNLQLTYDTQVLETVIDIVQNRPDTPVQAFFDLMWKG